MCSSSNASVCPPAPLRPRGDQVRRIDAHRGAAALQCPVVVPLGKFVVAAQFEVFSYVIEKEINSRRFDRELVIGCLKRDGNLIPSR
jgi:hypothetical protein